MSSEGQFDPLLVNDAWFDTTNVNAGWFDDDLIANASGGFVAYSLSCATGTYILAGQAATLNYSRTLTCDTGSYSIAGNPAALTYVPGAGLVNYVLTCDVGAYALAGQPATLTYARSLTASAGAYALSGVDATFTRGYSLVCDTGAYSIAGQAATLQRSYSLTCDAGEYSLAGSAATLLYVNGGAPVAYVLDCGSGSYLLVGQDATLYWSGASNGAGTNKRKKFQVQTEDRIIEVDSLDDVATLLKQAKAKREKVIDVKLDGIKVATPSTKPNINYKAIEAKLRASIQAEMDDEDDILMLLL
jgi:hypothetical protein